MAVMPEPPRATVSTTMYILTGEVVGYTEPISDPNNFRGEATGLKLKVLVSIQAPYYASEIVQLFMFDNDSDCFPHATENKPPLGTRFRLALYPATLVSGMSQNFVRLQSGVFDRITLSEPMFGYSTNSSYQFDYENDLPPLVERFRPPVMAEKRRSLDDFLYIEASKDLLRFQRAQTENERIKLLERLLYCPNIDYRALVLSKLGQPIVSSGVNFQSLQVLTPKMAVNLQKAKPQKLSKRKNELLAKRIKLEEAGKLNIWKMLRL